MKAWLGQRLRIDTLLPRPVQPRALLSLGSPAVSASRKPFVLAKPSVRTAPLLITRRRIQQPAPHYSGCGRSGPAPSPRRRAAFNPSIARLSETSPRYKRTCASHRLNLESSITYTGAATLFAVAGVVASLVLLVQQTTTDPNDAVDTTAEDMSTQLAPGHVGNLTPEQEEKLRKLWHSIFQLCGIVKDNYGRVYIEAPAKEKIHAEKKRFSVFRRKGNDKSGVSSEAVEDDKYGQTKQFQETLANQSPESIRETIWGMVKHDHPDALVLRFLRARKWDVEKALIMLVSTMSWRHNEMKVDSDIMKNGEGGALADEQGSDADADAKKIGHDFLAQVRMGKSFLHGTDKQGRPICVVRVRLHKQGEQCEESLERYTVYLIETARMVLTPPADTATILFDMTGFSMANMDYTPVKFMIKCFEANYPESLGAVLVHNAPWVFQGIWKIIRGWLDPVVAAKVHFTNNRSELEGFIEPSHILKELGGDEEWKYQYAEPVAGENDLMKDTETRDRLLQGREALVKDFEAATLQWIQTPDKDDGKQIKAKRDSLATRLKDDYWNLDPYVRARSLYDRQGILRGAAEVRWYQTAVESTAVRNGTIVQETSADDVD